MINRYMTKRLLTATFAVFTMFSTAFADWRVYDASQEPSTEGCITPSGEFSPSSSNTAAGTETAIIIDDVDNAGNKILEFHTIGDASSKLSFSESMTDAIVVENGFTAVIRAKATSVDHDMFELTFKSGTNYEKFRFYPDSEQINQEKGSGDETKINYSMPAGTSMLNWNVYRITMVESTISLWVNDVLVVDNAATTNSETTTTNFGFGDGNGSSTYSCMIDWFIIEETGAYAPGEGTAYPEDLVLSPLSTGGSTPGSWDVYDGSETPEAAGFSAGGSNTIGTSTIIDDEENAGNKILDMRSAGTEKWYWSSNHPTEIDSEAGFTVVYRMKGMSADSSSVGEMEVCGGGFRDKIRVYSDNRVNIEKAGVTVDVPEGVDVMDWNVYRVTFQLNVEEGDSSGYTQVWVNDTFVCEGYSTTTSSSKKYTIGDSNSSKSYAAQIDWIIRETTGAYSPYDSPDYPTGLVLSPISGGPVEVPDMMKFTETGVSAGQDAGSVEIQVEANTSWSLASVDSWITSISPLAGDSGTVTVTVTYEENTAAAPRVGTIYGMIGEELMDEITVTQEGAAEQLNVGSVLFSSQQVSGEKTNYAANVIDGDVATGWAPYAGVVEGEYEWIKLILDEAAEVAFVKIAEKKSNERNTVISVEAWNGTEYVEVVEKQITPTQSVAAVDMAFQFSETIVTDTLLVKCYGQVSQSETDPNVAQSWFTYTEMSAWGAVADPGTSVDNSELTISVFPNPTQGTLNIQNAGGEDLKLYSITGKLMFQKSNIEMDETVNFNVPSGLYLLQVGQSVSRLVVE